MTAYVAPSWDKSAFHCPHCQTYSRQYWGQGMFIRLVGALTPGGPQQVHSNNSVDRPEFIWSARCEHCEAYSVWCGEIMIWPEAAGGVPPNPDLPQDIKTDFLEARSIVNRSPRGAAALLRLCLQKLCKHLGGKGKKIDDDIAELVKKGLPVAIQQSLDVVRVVGNNAVHPGQMDFKDDPATASHLFALINFIADNQITQPNAIKALYESLPKNALAAIDKRDGK